MTNKLKITIVGAGAMGSLFGGLLAEGGADVTLLDPWKEHMDAVRRDGLKMIGHGGDRMIKLRALTDAKEIGETDLVFFQCKAVYNDAAADSVRYLFSAETQTIAISFQNGLGNEEKIAEHLGADRVLGGLTAQGANMEGPGCVRNHAELPTYIGEMSGELSERSQNIAEFLSQNGLPTQAVADIRRSIWAKLFANIGVSAPSGILDVALKKLSEDPSVRKVSYAAIEESVRVAAAEGLEFGREESVKVFNQITDPHGGTPGNKSSLCVDILNSRPTEIDYINGMVAKLGRKHGIPTPVNDILTAYAKALESKYTNAG